MISGSEVVGVLSPYPSGDGARGLSLVEAWIGVVLVTGTAALMHAEIAWSRGSPLLTHYKRGSINSCSPGRPELGAMHTTLSWRSRCLPAGAS